MTGVGVPSLNLLLSAAATLSSSVTGVSHENGLAITNTLSNVLEADQGQSDLAGIFDALARSVALGLAKHMVQGQEPTEFTTALVRIQSQLIAKGSGTSYLGMSDGAKGQIDTSSPGLTDEVVASFVSSSVNLHGNASSSQVSLSLYAPGSTTPLVLTNGTFTIYIPFAPGQDSTFLGDCVYWHEENATWATDGCTVVSKTAKALVCECTHLTTFSSLLVPPVVVPDWSVLTWANIMEEPTGFIFLMFYSCFFVLLSVFAFKRDIKLVASHSL